MLKSVETGGRVTGELLAAGRRERYNATLAPTYGASDFAVDALTATRLVESVPPNTRAAYSAARERFDEWCANEDRVALPATDVTLTAYVSHLITEGAAPATISQHIGAIRKLHRLAGHPGRPDSERALQLLRGYRRQRAEDGVHDGKATPILRDTLEKLVDALDLERTIGRRDQLLLVLGFAGMLRRSELAALQIGDVVETADGLEVAIRTSKTDKESRGEVVAVPPGSHPDLDPVRLVREWKALLTARGVTSGPLLRSLDRWGRLRGPMRPSTVNEVVRRTVKKAGLPDADTYSAHSLRSGGLTSSLRAGVPLGVAAAHGRWSLKSPVVIGYARTADRWRDNAMRGVL